MLAVMNPEMRFVGKFYMSERAGVALIGSAIYLSHVYKTDVAGGVHLARLLLVFGSVNSGSFG